jgi:hypothetical protein
MIRQQNWLIERITPSVLCRQKDIGAFMDARRLFGQVEKLVKLLLTPDSMLVVMRGGRTHYL